MLTTNGWKIVVKKKDCVPINNRPGYSVEQLDRPLLDLRHEGCV